MEHRESTSPPPPIGTDQIRADRACINCGFNLFGQQVYREPHYGLAIAVCPECNVVAALQSYPTMSHWVNRFRALLGAIWIVILLGVFVVNTALIASYTRSATEAAGQRLAQSLGEQYENRAMAPSGPPRIPGFLSSDTSHWQWVQIPGQWIDEHLPEAVAAAGGVGANLDREWMFSIIPASICAILTGVFWSLTLLGARARRSLLVPLLASATALVWIFGSRLFDDGNPNFSRVIAGRLYEPVLAPAMVLGQLTLSVLGALIGRRIARLLIVMSLPPRSRAPFSLLWTSDGLPLPRPSLGRATKKPAPIGTGLGV